MILGYLPVVSSSFMKPQWLCPSALYPVTSILPARPILYGLHYSCSSPFSVQSSDNKDDETSNGHGKGNNCNVDNAEQSSVDRRSVSLNGVSQEAARVSTVFRAEEELNTEPDQHLATPCPKQRSSVNTQPLRLSANRNGTKPRSTPSHLSYGIKRSKIDRTSGKNEKQTITRHGQHPASGKIQKTGLETNVTRANQHPTASCRREDRQCAKNGSFDSPEPGLHSATLRSQGRFVLLLLAPLPMPNDIGWP
ncbi:hypothetical protein WH47_10252 [Habropoda laboriosa]|uniref:Uncharacterized protein n=1 Tax=Habropoda laboriosa TaxID=597456 RepID=A0A0L7R4I0_9HYME|nr:hypothetical protein WH47_10252 [Habropoda laboriosa]